MIFNKKYKDQSNTELLQLYLQKGDVWAFQILYERYQSNLWNMYFAKTGNHEDSKDLIQQTYENLLKSKGIRENNIKEFENYLMGIAFNLLKQYYHRKTKAKQLQEAAKANQQLSEMPSTDPSQPEVEMLWKGIRQLSLKQQTAMELHLSEMSYKEIANQMGTTETVVGSLLNRARKRLKEILKHKER